MSDAPIDAMRGKFEDWFSDGGEYPKAIIRRGDSYALMTAASAWTAWQEAWSAALAYKASTVQAEPE